MEVLDWKPTDQINLEKGVYAKRDKLFRWRLVFPNKNTDGTINWFNLITGGSWGNIIGVFIIVCVMIGLVLAYKHDVAALVECCNRVTETIPFQIPKA